MSVEVVVPWLGGCPHREAGWQWARERYPYPVRVGEGSAPWVKALAAMPAIEASSAEIIVLADADVWCDGLPEAAAAVKDGAPWAIPHLLVHRLSEAGTAALLDGEDWRYQPLADGFDRRPYQGIQGGGYVIARREDLLSVPLDPRFVGWGQEDAAHALALYTLLGAPWRGDADLVHLFHPPAPRLSRKYGSAASYKLRQRYAAARNNPAAMRELLNEAYVARQPAQPRRDDHPALTVGG